jgi:hypothetical protein
MSRFIQTALALAVLAAAGCGGKGTELSGKVTFKGKPIVYGTVTVIGADGLPRAGTIEPDGSYRVAGIGPGPARVAVSSPPPPGAGPPPRPAVQDPQDEKPPPLTPPPADPQVVQNWFPIPDRFADPDRSEIKTEVGSGKPFNIDLQ